MQNKKKIIFSSICAIVLMICSILIENNNTISNGNLIQTSSTTLLSTKKIEWGIKRAENHQQPDIGSKNKELIEKYNGIAMGNSNSKKNLYDI